MEVVSPSERLAWRERRYSSVGPGEVPVLGGGRAGRVHWWCGDVRGPAANEDTVRTSRGPLPRPSTCS